MLSDLPWDFVWQMVIAAGLTLKLALSALVFGLIVGLIGAVIESIPSVWLRWPIASLIYLVRGLPELLVLFIIYFGATTVLSDVYHHYVDVSAFTAGTLALGMIFGSYASYVFRGAFLAVDKGQLDAGKAMGLERWQIFYRIQLPQIWRHALPGLENLWLVLVKDTSIVTLIGLSDLMNQAKLAANSTHQPFTFYLVAAAFYLCITSVSQAIFNYFSQRASRYI